MSRTIESPLSLTEARDRILALAEPVEAIEVSLGEALGLVLAEPVIADIDHPPFDRATVDGYAVKVVEATVGALLRVVRHARMGPSSLEAGEAGRVRAGDPMPPGSDGVARPSTVRPDPDTGPTRVIEVLDGLQPGQNVTRRGAHLNAGATLYEAGTRIKPSMVPTLASQGCVQPICRRRVGVSVLTVGSQWVGPADAPTMNRERNATNAALVALAIRAEAMPRDYQSVPGSKVRTALERATTAPVVLILGPPSPTLARALSAIGYEPVVERVAVESVGQARSGVIRDDDGKVINHVFQFPSHPVIASVAFTLLVQPLIARLQGDLDERVRSTVALAEAESQPATRRRTRVQPAIVRVDLDGRRIGESIPGSKDDFSTWSRADGLLIFPERSGPWRGGDPVEFVPIAPGF